MPQIVTCAECAQRLNIPDGFRGTRAKCPKCGAPVEVSPPSQAPTEPEVSSMSEDRPRFRRPADADTPQGSGAALGLGIGSLVVGILSFIIALIPCVGLYLALPLGTVGLILGIVGAIIAFTRKNAGLGMPIAGASVNAVAIVVAIAWFIGVQYLTKKGMESAQKGFNDVLENLETTTQPTVRDEPPPGTVWTKAREPVAMGDVRVKVTSVKMGKVTLGRPDGTQKPSNGTYIAITVEIDNNSPRDVVYQGWGTGGDAYVRDNFGQLLGNVHFGLAKVEGQAEPFTVIQAQSTRRDRLVFAKPSDGFQNLHLALPGQTIGGNGYLRFEIPADMVER